MTHRRLRLRAAFTITEMLGVLMLLSAFAVIGTRLFTASVKLTYNLGNAQDATASADVALNMLRSDVATAGEMKVTDGAIELTTPQGQPITWSIKSNQFLRREGNAEGHWRAPAVNITFSTAGDALVLKIDDPKVTAGFDEIWMTSQAKVLDKLTQP